MRGRLRTGIFAAIGLLLLILDSKTALAGAQEAVELCLAVVIPSLFPFFVLSGMLACSVSGGGYRILRPLERILGIPIGTGGLFLTGLVGGYPTGAQAVAEARKSGQLSHNEGKRMLAFCSNAGPAFLFGILGHSFSHIGFVWLLWGVHILSAVIVGVILPGRVKRSRGIPQTPPPSLPMALRKAVATTAYVCGWILLFRVILAFLSRWCLWLAGDDGQVAIYGLLELTNGCCSLHLIENEGLRLMIASGILAFGGLCVAMQTASVTGELGFGWYLPGKVLQAIISLILAGISAFLMFGDGILPSVFLVVIIGFPFAVTVRWLLHRNNEKNSSIFPMVGV